MIILTVNYITEGSNTGAKNDEKNGQMIIIAWRKFKYRIKAWQNVGGVALQYEIAPTGMLLSLKLFEHSAIPAHPREITIDRCLDR